LFGLSSAVLAPGGIALISYAVTTRSRKALEELTRVPEIGKLVDKAKSQEEKIRILEEERDHLEEVAKSNHKNKL
jgi:hypothetical protein